MDRDPGLGHGASGRVRRGRRRQRAIHRLGLRHGAGPHCAQPLWNSWYTSALRLGRALPGAGRPMNVSYEWLRAFVPFAESPARLRDLITSRVATVDEVVPLRQDLAPIVVARVVEEAPHPDSDHLHVTKVDAGSGELLDVVCGAPNVTAGKLYPFAPTGTVVAGGKKIERRKIRGALSNGMLCSVAELGLGTEQEGIWELDIDAAPGTPLLHAMQIGDSRLVDVELPD